MRGERVAARRGHTLLELLMVVFVIALMGGLALPRLRLERSQTDAAARTLGMAMLTARADAVSRGHNVLVVFDTARVQLRTVWDINNNRIADPTEKSRPFVLGERVVFGRGNGIPAFNGATEQLPAMRSSRGMPVIVVQRNGGLDRAGTVYFTARGGLRANAIPDSRAVRLDRSTGRATVFVYASNTWRRQ